MLLLLGGLVLSGPRPSHAQPRRPAPTATELISWDDPGDECGNENEGCDPVATILATVFVEFLPHLVDGVRLGPAVTPSGGAFNGRLEWGLLETRRYALDLGLGMWNVPRAFRSEREQLAGRQGALALTLSGSAPLPGPEPSSRATFRGVLDASVLWTDPAHLLVSVGPRYVLPTGLEPVSFDLLVGMDAFGSTGFAPHAGLRVGVRWD